MKGGAGVNREPKRCPVALNFEIEKSINLYKMPCGVWCVVLLGHGPTESRELEPRARTESQTSQGVLFSICAMCPSWHHFPSFVCGGIPGVCLLLSTSHMPPVPPWQCHNPQLAGKRHEASVPRCLYGAIPTSRPSPMGLSL